MNTKNNQRFKDTEERVKETLLHLLQIKPISQITVRLICEEAQINRSTFYAHYLDIPDLVKKLGKDMMTDIAELFRTSDSVLDFFLSHPHLTKMLYYVKEHRDLFDVYINLSGPNATDESFTIFFESYGKSYLKELGLDDESEMWYHFKFFQAGFLAILGRWLTTGCPEAPEKIATIILRNLPATPDKKSLSEC